jgi:hypothetical protein
MLFRNQRRAIEMNKLRNNLLATVGIASLVCALTIGGVRANNNQATVTSSTAHFSYGKTYVFNPVDGRGSRKCKVIQIDGAWLGCEGSSEWVNTNAMMFAEESR